MSGLSSKSAGSENEISSSEPFFPGIKVMLDMHGLRGSQTGFDHSGIANRTEWLSEDHFDHWSYAVGEWMGPWDFGTQSY